MADILAFGRLAVLYLALSVLILDPRNPRRHSARQIKQIARSIEAFGFVVPLLIDCRNRIVAGQGRFLAAQSLGLDVVPVIRLEHLTDAQANAFRIADNRLTELSIWDDRLLAETLKELSELDLDFSIEATGFTMGEIDLRVEGLSPMGDDAADPADQLPTPTGKFPISKSGDMWRLGRHTLLCGSALSGESYHALLGSKRAHIVFTDPPYNVPIGGHASGKGRIQHREFAMASGEMTEEQYVAFLTLACSLLARHSIDGSIHFVCMDWDHADALIAAGKASYSELKNICVWVKHNAGMGSFYRSQHEFVFVFKSGRGSHRNNVQLGQFGRNRTNVWSYPGANSFGRAGEEGNLLEMHPTVKPVRLVADAILDCSARGDVVLDPFLGSGTTLIAAERTGRTCFGMEIDPLYVDTVIRRWQAYTGEHAICAATGLRFDDVFAASEPRHV